MNSAARRVTVAVLGAIVSACVTWAAEPMRTGSALLTLAEGIKPAEPGDRETRDMELELTLRDGKFEKPVWGYAVGFNKADHDGEVVAADGDRVTVKLTLNKDMWFPATPGEAQYQMTLKREGDTYSGEYTGSFAYPATEGPVTRAVKGKVTGTVVPLWTEPRAGFKKLEPNEHPRLIFRKSDLPMLKQRLETPEGKAILARFLAQLPKQHATHDKNIPFFPAGYGLAWQLTGDKAHADKAKDLLSSMLGLRGEQDIHFGPMAQSIAVTLDLCYDAWDAAFRQMVVDNLVNRIRNLDTLTGMSGASLSPWHNHEGVRAGSVGVAAICLLGEKTGDGKEIPGLERLVHRYARAIRRYFQYNGTSNTGYCLEGAFYKRMTWNSGPGHMIQAYRTAMGGDPLAGWVGHWSVIGEWMDQPPSDRGVIADSLGNDQSAGLWPVGLVTVPDSMKAGTRWLFDRSFGLEGNKTFGIFWAYHAGYVLMNYPFDVPARPPSESLPWMAPDPTGGYWIFRKPWQGGKDSLVVLHLCSGLFGGCHHERSGRIWDMQLFALGRQWIGDGKLSEAPGPGAALPLVGSSGAVNGVLGPKVKYWNATPDGKAVLSLDMEPVYMRMPPKGTAPAEGQKTARFRRFGVFLDPGIRATRDVAVDLSGACGAPALMAFADKYTGAGDVVWNLKTAKDAGPTKVEGNTATVGDPNGPNLRMTVVSPLRAQIRAGLAIGGTAEPEKPARPTSIEETIRRRAAEAEKPEAKVEPKPQQPAETRDYEFLVVLTVQNGAAPEVKTEGQGLAAKVTIGGQTMRLDGGRIVLTK